MTEHMIPVDRVRAVVEEWKDSIAQENSAGLIHHGGGYAELEEVSGIRADTWRFRLSDGEKRSVHKRWKHTQISRGWFHPDRVEIDFDDVDEFLAAAGLTHLWHTELADLVPEPEDGMSEEEFDSTCASCSRSIDWSKGAAGVRIEVGQVVNVRRSFWHYSLCSTCWAKGWQPPRNPDTTGRVHGKIPETEVLALYLFYVSNPVGIERTVERVWHRHGFASARTCALSLEARWRALGWPTRDRHETKRLNATSRRGRSYRIPHDDLVRLHTLHVKGEKLSINELGRRVWERYGYSSPQACANSISRAWKILGLQARDRIEMTVEMSTKDGLSPRDARTRRRLRVAAGLTTTGKARQQRCAGTLKRTGKPCPKPAMKGHEFCYTHAPEHQEMLGELLNRMRGKSPIHNPERLEPIGPLQAELQAFQEWHGVGAWTLLAAELPPLRNRQWLSRMAKTPQVKNISRDVARQVREAMQRVTAPDAARSEAT